MPLLRGLNVRVTNADGHAFDEWGVQQLRRQNKISAYIKSKSEEAFHISIQPELPFLESDVILDGYVHDNAGEGNSGNPSTRNARYDRISHQQSSPSMSLKHGHFEGRSYNTKERISSPIKEQPSHRYAANPPFDLLASLYLDGRQKPERRAIVYLDPKYHDFPQPDGKIRFRARWTQGENGTLVEHAWVFKDVRIENVFDKLSISKSRNRVNKANHLDDDDAMIAAMNATELGVENNIKNDEKCSIGQIVIVVQRIIVGVKWSNENYRPEHRGGEADDVNMDDLSDEITHTAKHTYFKTIPAGPVNVVDYRPFVNGERPYATFQFFYRSQEILDKFNFPGYRKSRKLSITDRLQVERKFIDLTPLSISHPVQPSKFSGKTFEQRIKDNSFDHEEEKTYNFNQPYREAVAVKEKPPTESHVKKRASRSNALLRPTIAPELFNHLSGERRPLLSDLYGKEIMPNENTSERAEIAPSITTPRPNVPKTKTTVTAATSYKILLTGAQAIPGHFSSPFETQRTDLHLISSTTEPESIMKSKAILPKPSLYLKRIFKESRIFSEGSDADDERDESGLETETEDEDLEKDLSAQEGDDATNRDQDDGGLHADFKEMTIGKKRHLSNDNGDEGYQSDDYGGTARNNPENGAAAQLAHQEVKAHSFPSGHLLNATCKATTDDTIYRVGSSSPCNESKIRKQQSAQRLPKRIKS